MGRRSTEKYPGQRTSEKRELFKRFRLRAIEDIYKNRFFALFDNRCFKCGKEEKRFQEIGSTPNLCIDHHVPMALGGHLVPGNLVALCRRCNNVKLDRPPESFYTAAELEKLQPILARQEEVFSFSFDWDAWHDERREYLLRVGVDAALVTELLFNPCHPDFVGTAEDRISFTISVELCDGKQER
jgi:hypothetical protein